jgi:hypothetical protein
VVEGRYFIPERWLDHDDADDEWSPRASMINRRSYRS